MKLKLDKKYRIEKELDYLNIWLEQEKLKRNEINTSFLSRLAIFVTSFFGFLNVFLIISSLFNINGQLLWIKVGFSTIPFLFLLIFFYDAYKKYQNSSRKQKEKYKKIIEKIRNKNEDELGIKLDKDLSKSLKLDPTEIE